MSRLRQLLTPDVVLYLLFVVGFSICGASIFRALQIEHILDLDEGPLWTSLFEVYSVPIGALVAGSIARKSSGRPSWQKSGFVVILALIWNAVLIWKFSSILSNSPPERAAIVDFAELIARRGNFLIAGVLTFYSAKAVKS